MLRRFERRGRYSPADPRRDAWAAAAVLLMVGGLYLDGWAHLTLLQGRLGGFVTPWHGVLYAGWALTGLAVVTAGQRGGEGWCAERVPSGYGVGLVGLALTLAGAVTDVAWHELFGEEEGIGRLLSPPHLFLFLGMALLASTPLRSAWLRHGSSPGAAALVSAAATLAIVMFVTQPISPFVDWSPRGELATWKPLGVWLTAGLVVAAPLLLGRRWSLVAGCAVVSGSVCVALALAGGCPEPRHVAAALAGALLVDAATWLTRRTPFQFEEVG